MQTATQTLSMDKAKMKELIREELTRTLGDNYHVRIDEILKNNGLRLDGLSIMPIDGNMSPTLYLEPYYEDILNGMSPKFVADRILSKFKTLQRGIQTKVDMKNFLDFEKVKPKLFVKLINKHMNEELLKDLPHQDFLDDFAIIACVLVSKDENGCVASITTRNQHVKIWNTTSNELIKLAIDNTRNLFDFSLVNTDELISEFCISDEEFEKNEYYNPNGMFALTNSQRIDGACMALYKDILDDFGKKYGDFYIVFSSIHEALLIPVNQPNSHDKEKLTHIDVGEINEIMTATNETVVAEAEILGVKAYTYKVKEGIIVLEQ
jgi:hypothetical protein